MCHFLNCSFLGSKERDIETGLDYLGFRYYSSIQGRFTSPDEPLLDQWEIDPQSWNLYSYVRNNPLKYTDPLGLWKEIAPGTWEWEKDDTWEGLAKKLNVNVNVLKNAFQNITLGAGIVLNIGDPSNLHTSAGIDITLNQSDLDAEELAEIQQGSGGGVLVMAGVTAVADGPEPGPADLIAIAILGYALLGPKPPPPHVILSENKDTQKKIAGLVGTAVEHLGKLQTSPPNDPNRDHWKKEIKAALDRAKRLAERLPGKIKEAIKKEIESIENQTANQPGKQ